MFFMISSLKSNSILFAIYFYTETLKLSKSNLDKEENIKVFSPRKILKNPVISAFLEILLSPLIFIYPR
ncbi:hypothetical protein C4K46_03780 [Streptococcus oricebi]|uniref:Uncharacterized protein n=1 Tax=Streptococcus oricebi TaxID=1547447 RepID=A0ABS5B2J1_9STRE|nr:hypothetical protein [Streptococcus oricebi]